MACCRNRAGKSLEGFGDTDSWWYWKASFAVAQVASAVSSSGFHQNEPVNVIRRCGFRCVLTDLGTRRHGLQS
jgi:hypothetical protein